MSFKPLKYTCLVEKSGYIALVNNQLKTIFFLGVLSALVIGVGSLVAPGYWWVFVLVAGAMNIGSYFFSDKLVLRMNNAHEVSEAQAPQLHAIVSDIAARADIPKPKVYVVDDPTPNAFATGRNPEHGVVAVTSGILNVLSREELRGVIAHEIAHIKNRDILIATIGAIAASVISFVATFALWFGRGNSRHPFAGILVAIFAPIAATIVQMAISRSREYLADQRGAELSEDPDALARALGKLAQGNARRPLRAMQTSPASASLYICSPFSGQSMANLFSTHPPIPERIRRLQAMA